MAGGKGHLHEEFNGLLQGGYSEVLIESKDYRLYFDSPVAHMYFPVVGPSLHAVNATNTDLCRVFW